MSSCRASLARFVIAVLMAVLAVAQVAAQPPGAVGVRGAGPNVWTDQQYAEGLARDPSRNRLDLYVPNGTASAPPLVMFVHGGTWTGGNKEQFEFLGRRFAAEGIACAVANMQQYPFARPDAMVVDCAHALGWLHARAREFGYDGDRLFVMGHSSGAHLAAWLAFDEAKLADAGVPRAAVRGAILLSGVYDVRPRHQALDAVFGHDPAFRAAASPFRHVDRADPPAFVVWGEHELPGLALTGRVLGDRLWDAAVPFVIDTLAGHDHADYLFQLGAAHDPVLARIVAFVRDPAAATAHTAPPPSPGAVLWVANDAAERALAQVARRALAMVGVAVQIVDDARSGDDVAARFRALRAGAGAPAPSPTFVAGCGLGGLLAACAPLQCDADGLRGRIVVAAPLGQDSLAAAGCSDARAQLGVLVAGAARAPLLLLQGELDAVAVRGDALQLARNLLRAGVAVDPVELVGTCGADAIARLAPDDDLLLPLLLAFLRS